MDAWACQHFSSRQCWNWRVIDTHSCVITWSYKSKQCTCHACVFFSHILLQGWYSKSEIKFTNFQTFFTDFYRQKLLLRKFVSKLDANLCMLNQNSQISQTFAWSEQNSQIFQFGKKGLLFSQMFTNFHSPYKPCISSRLKAILATFF